MKGGRPRGNDRKQKKLQRLGKRGVNKKDAKEEEELEEKKGNRL